MKQTNIFLIAASILLVMLVGCGPTYTYSAEPVDATVVDAQTGKPMPGTVVVAYWELHGGSLTGDSLPCAAANVEEAVTDSAGKFHIPGWGPFSGRCSMPDGLPLLFFFKSGYKYQRLANVLMGVEPVSLSRSEWNGKTIAMERFPNLDMSARGPQSYATEFGYLNGELESFIVNLPAECNWKKVPNLLRALISQEKQFDAAGYSMGYVVSALIANDAYLQRIAPQCGSPKEFIEGLEK